MHKPLSKAEVEALNSAIPVPGMTRVEKLNRWAMLLRQGPGIVMYRGLEYMPESVRNNVHWTHSPMSYAAADPVFQDAGLKDDTVGEAKRFFELSDEDLHAFTCNCGGVQTGEQMAQRVEAFGKSPSLGGAILKQVFG